MTQDTARVLTGGPALVERATGKKLTKEELGGAKVHPRSGVVDNVAADEDDALRQIRAFLSYLPSSVYELAPVGALRRPARSHAKRSCSPSSRASGASRTRCAA